MVTDAAEHGWLCGPLIRGRSPVRFRVLRLRAGKCPAGAHNPGRPGAVPGPATNRPDCCAAPSPGGPVRLWGFSSSGKSTSLAMRRRSVRARQAPHRPGRPIPPWRRPDPKPRWWSWPTRLPFKEEITGSNPVRGTSTAGGDHSAPTGGALADVVERRHALRLHLAPDRAPRCREAWGCKSPRRHNASRPGGPPAFVPPGPGVDTPGRLWPRDGRRRK
jgi:hypothetical protein